jgi:hypothetical protein
MARFRNRPKTTYVDLMKVTVVQTSGVVQVGDVLEVRSFSRVMNTGGPRGAPSFVTFARHIHSATRLHFADQEDSEFLDEIVIRDESSQV